MLFGVSLAVARGEVLALLGPNGAGKTTTLRSILGLTPARRGRDPLRRPRHHARADAPDRPRRHRLGAGRPAHLPDADGGAQPRDRAQDARAFAPGRSKECFEIFSALEYLMARECENLSGGEMQMVAISRALLGAPGLVLFDEPSQGLAPKVVQDVMTHRSRACKRRGRGGARWSSRTCDSALAVADRVCVLRRGPHRARGRGRGAARRRRAARARWLGV